MARGGGSVEFLVARGGSNCSDVLSHTHHNIHLEDGSKTQQMKSGYANDSQNTLGAPHPPQINTACAIDGISTGRYL